MITLYTFPSGNGYRASIMLEEMGLDYVAQGVDLRPGAEKPPAFLAASPLGKIPAIIDHDADVAIAESLAIALYLVDKTGQLRPKTAAAQARALQWAAIVATGFGSAIPGIFFAKQLDEAAHAPLIAKYYADLNLAFGAMETALADCAYLADDDYSYADALAAPLLPTARAFGIDLSVFPNVERWGQAVHARPAVQRGMAVKG